MAPLADGAADLGGWPAAIGAAFVALVVGPFLPAVLKLLFGTAERGLLHSWDQWRDAQARREAEREQSDRDRVVQVLQQAVDTLTSELATQKTRVEALQDEIDALRIEADHTIELQAGWIRETTAWVREVLLWAAEGGHELPPGWRSYFAWLEAHRVRSPHPREPPGP
ncbi:hypothetical protein CSPHI_05100 [Corynebacterium sphenisci DSM 44792]|uniref:Uncharacterized protein n=1 Tax=Corynebacterium sphenisci DSM 44792 TaxID=1437874 RepID=A0A1L7CXB2_9CORY|nr:hypothetical protein [Corynebacterium sphenisci]APT90515.1 hypothetical protein CSPHI_05100 [Corynebacterium sphenisci DSM 44792]